MQRENDLVMFAMRSAGIFFFQRKRNE